MSRFGRFLPVFLFFLPGLLRADTIQVQLLYNNQPLKTAATPDISCRDDTRMTWIDCGVQSMPGMNIFAMPRPPSGKYMIHVQIDDNPNNPARYPGDYDIFQPFDVTPTEPTTLAVHMNRIIHLTAPWDNGKPLEGMLTSPPAQKPSYPTPRYSLRRKLPMTFTWEPLVDGAEYDYCVIQSNAGGRRPDIIRSKTRETTVTLLLPPTPADHYYEFSVAGRANGRVIGDFFTHDGGAQGWTCEFRVANNSLPLWLYPLALAALGVVLWAGVRIPWREVPALKWGAVAVAVGLVLWQAGRLSGVKKTRKQVEQSQAELQAERSKRNQAFLAEWQAAVPKPAWWDAVPPTGLSIHNLGDLLSVWQSGANNEESGRRFYKLAYQAVLEHPDDEQLVPMGIHLMAYCDSGPQRLSLLKFGVEKFFHYNQRTDNCANCMVGDTVGEMVRDLAGAYIGLGEYDSAVAVIQRLVKERQADISPYNLALTFEVLSRAHWKQGNTGQAIEDIHEGLRRFPSGWQADQLRKTLESYQKTG